MHDPLAPLLADGVIDECLGRLKSGKEADIWLVRHGDEVVAAKVYKERKTRSFKNDAAYKEGRQVRNTRTQRAMDRGTKFGQQASEEAWKSKESDTLYSLYAAGVRVPRPVMFYEGVLLMELVLEPEGQPAPRLVDAHVLPEHARLLYEDLRAQVIKILCCDLIHGDLSPYNILAGANGPVIIDFPQVIGAAHNSQAETFFLRDLENVRKFFEAADPTLRTSAGDGREIWRAYTRRELTPEFLPTGKLPPEPVRQPDPRPRGPERRGGGRPDHGGGGRPDQRAGGRPQQEPPPNGQRRPSPEGRPQHPQQRGPGGGQQQRGGPGRGPPPGNQPAQQRPGQGGRPQAPQPPRPPGQNQPRPQQPQQRPEAQPRPQRRPQQQPQPRQDPQVQHQPHPRPHRQRQSPS
jgi:RIO kinase 1